MGKWYEIAMEAYKAYAKITDNKNFRGDPMPEFHELPDTIKRAWEAAASRSVHYCIEISYNGLDWSEEYKERVKAMQTMNNGDE